MPSVHIRKDNNTAVYFITFTIIHWYYFFDRHERWHILANALTYCIENKGLQIYGFVFMLNHMHLLFSSPDASGFVRDFKKFTSKEFKKNILETEPVLMKLFLKENEAYQFWHDTNMPILIESESVYREKLAYIHNNPVKKQYVEKREYWYWSSANPHCPIPLTTLVL